MRETDATIARMWADHTSREIGAIIGRSAEYVRVRAQRLDLPRKREMRGGWQRKECSNLPALSNRGTAVGNGNPRRNPERTRTRPERAKTRPERIIQQRLADPSKRTFDTFLQMQEEPAPTPQRRSPTPRPKPSNRGWIAPPIIRFDTCQWMIGKGCTHPTKDGAPWCDEHRARVYGRGGPSDD